MTLFSKLFFNFSIESVKEEGGGIVISGARSTNQINIAKSLPMNIPTFMSPLHNHASDDSDDLMVRINLFFIHNPSISIDIFCKMY